MLSNYANKIGATLKIRLLLTTVILCLFGFYISDDAKTREPVEVVRVIDGDTVVLADDRHVRLLGINAPEISHQGGVNEAGAIKTKEVLESLLANTPHFLESDKESLDHYGRTLAYLFNEEGSNINVELVKRGLATVSLYPPNLKYSLRLINAQQLAEIEGLGIWGLPSYELVSINDLPQTKKKGWGRFRGEVTKIDVNKKGVKVWMGEDVYIWIKQSNLRYFSDLDDYLQQLVEVRGWPRKWGKYWSIQARHSSQLINLED